MANRSLTKVLMNIDPFGEISASIAQTVTLKDLDGTTIASATENPTGTYVASWAPTNKWGHWYIGAVAKTAWGRVWLGDLNTTDKWSVGATGATDKTGSMYISGSDNTINTYGASTFTEPNNYIIAAYTGDSAAYGAIGLGRESVEGTIGVVNSPGLFEDKSLAGDIVIKTMNDTAIVLSNGEFRGLTVTGSKVITNDLTVNGNLKINGTVSSSDSYARTNMAETFNSNVTVEANLLVTGSFTTLGNLSTWNPTIYGDVTIKKPADDFATMMSIEQASGGTIKFQDDDARLTYSKGDGIIHLTSLYATHLNSSGITEINASKLDIKTNTVITGSLIVTAGITGSIASASYAENGGKPTGAWGSLQYNNSGSLAGTTNISYTTGSLIISSSTSAINIFGNSLSDTHIFSGSVHLVGTVTASEMKVVNGATANLVYYNTLLAHDWIAEFVNGILVSHVEMP